MTKKDSFSKVLKDRIRDAVRDAPVNQATAINVGKGHSRTRVSTRQTITHRNGTTEVTEVREERRES